ncbi:hypothetical protein [Streptomyces sp. NPDC102283]|uniref:hypothetical protein n=1 Tax=Streptomyces sp. NPDC102283 TaxID=3366155 RepID=UPI00382AF630
MTMTQRRMRRAPALTANPSQGIRVHRAAALRRTAAGRYALPLTVEENGRPLGPALLVLTHADAAQMRAELDRLLDGDPTPARTGGSDE